MNAELSLQRYNQLLAPARERFERSPGLNAIRSTNDPRMPEAFLLYFCVIGARMTEPVETWIRQAADRCAIVGFPELGEALSLLIWHSDINAVRGAIEQLPLIFREVILLCDAEDASYREIADKFSIPIGTVMSRLAKARKMVRESLRSNHVALPSRGLSHSGVA